MEGNKMPKATVRLESDDEVAKMILGIFKGKDGARNVLNIITALSSKDCGLYDKDFDKAIRKLRPELFKS